MKKEFIKNKIVVVFLFSLLIPNLVFASWWNPFTWRIFNKTSSSINTTIPTATSPTEDQSISKAETQSLTSIKFDDVVIKSSLMIKVFDNNVNQYILQGSGISLGGLGNILTNYHVAEKVFLNPNRYKAYGCVTILLDTVPTCNYLLSPTRKLLSGSTSNTQYSKDLDLALLYIDQVKVNEKWLSVIDTSLDNLKDRSINLSSYTKNYNDLAIGSPVYSVGYPDFGGEKTIQVDGVVKEIGKNQSNGQVWVLTALNISHGNSGGPVFNSKGELVGVTVACLKVSPDSEKCKSNSGFFIPLPSVNWWYTQANNSHIITWEGKNYYSSNNGISDDNQKAALCLLRQNSYYDANISTGSCTCKVGYPKKSTGDCVDVSGSVDPTLRYGKAPDPEAEKKALQMLDDLFSEINKGSTNIPSATDQIKSYIYDNFYPTIEKFNEGLEYTKKGVGSAADKLRVDAEKYLNYSIESFNNAASILGENPPVGWIQTHNCMVSMLINSVTASVYLKSSLYYSGTPKAMEYIETAQTFTHKADEDQACVLRTKPVTP